MYRETKWEVNMEYTPTLAAGDPPNTCHYNKRCVSFYCFVSGSTEIDRCLKPVLIQLVIKT